MIRALTTMEQPCEEMVSSSIKLLMDAIEGNEVSRQLIFKANLVERDSVLELKDR